MPNLNDPIPTEDTSPIMNVPQVCAYLGVGRDMIYALAATNKIPHFHVGRHLRFHRDDIDAWARGHEHRRADLYGGRAPKLLKRVR